jgi:hypothetical protein
MQLRLLFLVFALAARGDGPPFTVSGQGLPSSLASPSCDQGSSCGGSTPGTLSRSLMVENLVVVNTDTSSHTFTLEDCQATPFVLYSASTLTAGQVITLAGPVRFSGCLQWSANSTKVMGSVVYR